MKKIIAMCLLLIGCSIHTSKITTDGGQINYTECNDFGVAMCVKELNRVCPSGWILNEVVDGSTMIYQCKGANK